MIKPQPSTSLVSRRQRWLVSASLVVGALGLGACVDGDDDENVNGTGTDAGTEAATSTQTGSDDQSGSGDASTSTPVEVGEPWDTVQFDLVTVAALSQPTSLAVRPATQELWVAERAGRIRVIDWSASADSEEFVLRSEPALNIVPLVGADGEGGLLGITFSADGDKLFVNYTDRAIDTVIAEYTVDQATGAIDPASSRTLLQIDQPFSNHNGGEIQFGPDGLLYIGLGDGGSSGDPEGNGQNPSTLLGSLLRIDPTPDGESPFTIPADNPLVGNVDGRDEIWLWGVRNPWRFSFDAETGDLWVADVGQGEAEEITLLRRDDGLGRGENLGWNILEGNLPFAGDADPALTAPTYEYLHGDGACSVTGGHVYRGEFAPSLDGVYLFADYCQNTIVGLDLQDDGSVISADLLVNREVEQVISFGLGPANEVFVMEQVTGRIARLQPSDLELETITATS